ncbi:hypothetical protein RI129_012984 [Pyrocoelia pectoralis]|uniref:Farnesol dehydrogenase n=1 Tax=Pyrocoelia pectoralis TaxID=417401 RepID=A0AAN7V8B8_9COLE
MERWLGKVAVVTGASDGIGAEISKKLVNVGLHVVGLARNEEKLEKLCGELKSESGRFYPFKTDMTKEEDILKAFQWIEANVGPVHVLVNNAGISQNKHLFEGSTEMWKNVLDTNVIGLCVATREAVKSISPGFVDTEIGSYCNMNVPIEFAKLKVEDVADAALYVLGTPGHVQVYHNTIHKD